jgi:hypothetical protein
MYPILYSQFINSQTVAIQLNGIVLIGEKESPLVLIWIEFGTVYIPKLTS